MALKVRKDKEIIIVLFGMDKNQGDEEKKKRGHPKKKRVVAESFLW